MEPFNIKALEASQRDIRQRALAHRVCYALRDTLQVRGVTPETNVDDVRVDFTDDTMKALAPLLEAVDILEAIVWASDGCIGHKHCAHSMEPWQRARALLDPKWKAEWDPSFTWPL